MRTADREGAQRDGVTSVLFERRWNAVSYLHCLLEYRRTHNANALLAAALDLQQSALVDDSLVIRLSEEADAGETTVAAARAKVITAWQRANAPSA